MLERIENINKQKILESTQNNFNITQQIEIRNDSLLKEKYSKSTLLGMYEKLLGDITSLKKSLYTYENENTKIAKLIEKEKLEETAIKEKVNQFHNKARKIEIVHLYKLIQIKTLIEKRPRKKRIWISHTVLHNYNRK